MNSYQELSLEQQFELKVFADQVRQLSLEESHQLLVQLRETMLIQANNYREIIKDAWKLDQGLDAVL